MRGSLLYIAALALAAGCDLGAVPGVGGTDATTDTGSGSGSNDAAAAAAFTSMITPIVTSATHNCAQATCHGGTQPPKFTAFADFKASGPPLHTAGEYLKKPWTSNVINTKTATLGAPPMHQGLPWLDATEQTTFMTFITTYGQ